MPQPDSSRDRALDRRWNEVDAPWPVDPAAPRRFGSRAASRPVPRPERKPDQDGRTPDDRDGNEELEREQKEKPSSQRVQTDRQEGKPGGNVASASWYGTDAETDDTGEWVATQPFTIEDELEDTWPNVPTRYLDD